MQIANYFCYRLNMSLAQVVTFVLPIDATFGSGGNVRATD